MDRIEVMRLFIRVADSGNFSKVARATGVSQPTVSKLIAGLEAKLGVQLLRVPDWQHWREEEPWWRRWWWWRRGWIACLIE